MTTDTKALLLLSVILVALAVALMLAAQTELQVCEFVPDACETGQSGGTNG